MLDGYKDDFVTHFGRGDPGSFFAILVFVLLVYFCFSHTPGHGSFDHKPFTPLPPVTCDASVSDALLICIGD